MLNIEINNEAQRASNFLLGYVDDDDCVSLGFMPVGASYILERLLAAEKERLYARAYALLEDRDEVAEWQDWHRLTQSAQTIIKAISEVELLLVAFHWHDGSHTSFDFDYFCADIDYEDDEAYWLDVELEKESHLK